MRNPALEFEDEWPAGKLTVPSIRLIASRTVDRNGDVPRVPALRSADG